jgi:hypothetical protein
MSDRQIRIEVYGVREAIAYLQEFEPKAYRKIASQIRVAVKPVADKVGSEFPEEPLDQWHTTGGRKGKSRMPPYIGASARSKVRPVVSTRQRKRGNEHGIVRLQQFDGGGQVYDSAGSVTAASSDTMGGRFIQNLDKHLTTKSVQGRTRSRVMYPAAKKYLPEIIDKVQKIIDDFGGEVQKNINRK